MISNLENGYTEDGSENYPNEAYKNSEWPHRGRYTWFLGSLVIWRRRESKILATCLSIYLATQDFPSAIETVYQMIDKLEPLGDYKFLYGTLGRIYLQVWYSRIVSDHMPLVSLCINICSRHNLDGGCGFGRRNVQGGLKRCSTWFAYDKDSMAHV